MPFTFACFKNFHFEIDFDFLSVISISFDKQLSLLIMFSCSYSVFHAVRLIVLLSVTMSLKFVFVFFLQFTRKSFIHYFSSCSHIIFNLIGIFYSFSFYVYSKAMKHFISFINEAVIFRPLCAINLCVHWNDWSTSCFSVEEKTKKCHHQF